jgi:cbb3-type cytochrome oxidase subunit 3
MKQLVLQSWNAPYLSVVALIIFISVFIGAVFWVFRKDSKVIYDEISNLVFDEGLKND